MQMRRGVGGIGREVCARCGRRRTRKMRVGRKGKRRMWDKHKTIVEEENEEIVGIEVGRGEMVGALTLDVPSRRRWGPCRSQRLGATAATTRLKREYETRMGSGFEGGEGRWDESRQQVDLGYRESE